ncbi:hypothetical protein [Paenibacillus polymyxa]|uniref:hypothetical protein n=1 Tax=Paenibacillus polymyxa TaxID=1406 RepID=UPI003D2D2464
MKTFKIRIIAKFNTKNELFIPGEVHEARRISYNIMDFKTPFQIVSGKKSGEEVPFKYAVVLPDKPQPTQHQFDAIVKLNGDLLADLAVAREKFSEISDALGEREGRIIPTIRQLVQDKAELLQTIERHTNEQLNTEKLLQRIRELETIANGRAEMLKSFSFKLVPYVSGNDSDLNTAIDRILEELEERRNTQNPVELPYVTVKAMNKYFKNEIRRKDRAAALLNILSSPARELTSPARHIKEYFNGDSLRLAESVVLGFTVAPEQDEASATLEAVTALLDKWYHSPATDNDTQVLAEKICDFIREREAAGEAVTI